MKKFLQNESYEDINEISNKITTFSSLVSCVLVLF